MKFNIHTQRGEIYFERAKEWIKVGLLAAGLLAIVILGCVSCANGTCAVCRACGFNGCRACNGEEHRTDDFTPHAALSPVEEQNARLANRESLAEVETYPRLIDAEHPLAADYVPPGLTRLYGMPDGVENQMSFEAATAFEQLYNAILADGMALIPLSGYRTYQEQVDVYQWNLELHVSEGMTVEAARAYTSTLVAIPGTSEHQYGRSIDVTIDGTTNHTFHETEQGKWLIAHAHEYGFIVRYPADKVEITKIAYEPWHLRYVGVEHAAYMHKYGICLEEYIQLVRNDNPSARSEE